MAGSVIQSRDILCESPSAAASFVLGRTVNGWEEWTDCSDDSIETDEPITYLSSTEDEKEHDNENEKAFPTILTMV